MRKFLLPLITSLLLPLSANAQVTNTEAASGLKEALTHGAEMAVNQLGKQNGFMGDSRVKIPLPSALQTAEKAMRLVGQGKYADELIQTMNHAAELAVIEAKPVMVNAIKQMSFDDARGILSGGNDSATQYFRRTTSNDLTSKFMPIVKQATAKVDLAAKYNKYASKAASAGLLDAKDADLDAYVTQKTLDGLFVMLAEQEKAIRKDPVSTGSALLKKLFGH